MGVEASASAGALTSTGEGSRGRRRRVLAAVLAAGVLAAGGWWWSHPSEFGAAGNMHGLSLEPGQTMYSGMSREWGADDPEVRLVDAEPRSLYNRVGLAAAVLVCEQSRPSLGVGVVSEDRINSVCADLRSPSGHDMRPGDTLVLQLAADERTWGGVAVFEGIDVTYSTGLQRGTEHTGVVTEVRVGR